MKLLYLCVLFTMPYSSMAQTVWGTNNSRTETKNNPNLPVNQGGLSGFFETSAPDGFPVDPDFPTANWTHLLDIRHSNLSSNYAMQFAGSFYTPNLYFRKTMGNNNTPWNRVLLEQGGKVGIGTTNPRESLQFGDRFNIMDGGWKGIQYNVVWSPTLSANTYMVTAPSAAMYFTDQGKTVFFNAPTGNAGSAIANGTHSMVMYANGQVGVGTSYLSNSLGDIQQYRFFVDGGIKARRVKVDLVNWADFVFSPDYKLRSIDELKLFILTHKHLPDVPTEKEVLKDGIEVGDMNKILLQKIEELTLYIIQLKEELDEVKKKVNN
jgi:hypothetical protein